MIRKLNQLHVTCKYLTLHNKHGHKPSQMKVHQYSIEIYNDIDLQLTLCYASQLVMNQVKTNRFCTVLLYEMYIFV